MDLTSLRRRANLLRFNFHRSWRRAGARQVERLLTNFFERPVASNPRRLASIGLTHRCQGRCEWCATGAYRKDAKGELSTAEVERLLRELTASRFVFSHVSFLGGEPLLRRDVAHLVRYAADLGLFVHLSTNALKLDASCTEILLDSGLNSVFIAWELGAARDEAQRRRKEAALRAVRHCVDQGLPCFLSVCVCREHVFSGELETTIALAKSLGVAGVRLFAVRLSGQWLWQGSDQILGEREEQHLRSLCRSGYVILTDDAAVAAGRSCAAITRRIVYISPYGEVQPCHFFPFSFGSAKDGELDSSLERMWSHPMLTGSCDGCLLHDSEFRSQHIVSMSQKVQLPVSV